MLASFQRWRLCCRDLNYINNCLCLLQTPSKKLIGFRCLVSIKHVVPPKSSFSRLYQLSLPERGKIMGAVGFLLISSGITMSVPFAVGKIIDVIYLEAEHTVLTSAFGMGQICVGLMCLFGLGGLCNFARVYLTRIVTANITARLRQTVFSAILRQDIAFFDNVKTGELVSRLSDAQVVSQSITLQISDGLRSGFMVLTGVSMMLFMSPQLTIVALCVVPPVALWSILMGRKLRKISGAVQDTIADSSGLAEEKIANIRTVRAFSREIQEIEAYGKAMKSILIASQEEAMAQAKFFGVAGMSGNMIVLTVLFYGGSLVSEHVMSVGDLTSFVLYAAYVGIGLNGLSSFYAELMKGLGATRRLFELVDKKQNIEVWSGITHDAHAITDTSIRFEDVSFAYPSRSDIPVLRNISFLAPAGRVLAIVGSSGSGKSTIAALLMRFYDPGEGKIFIGDVNIRSVHPSLSLRRYIGFVSQEPVLFSCSVADNILYGLPLPNKYVPDWRKAAKEANADEFISGFPARYDTVVGERGLLLSGGQKQRVAIARAILKNPEILILDEATSALDAISEDAVSKALQKIMFGRTVIVIAHRLSTIRNADKICVMDAGRIVEEGSFEQLLQIPDGRFQKLMAKQTTTSA